MFSRDIIYWCSYSLLFLESHFEALKALCKESGGLWQLPTGPVRFRDQENLGLETPLFSEAVFRGRPALFPGLVSTPTAI